MVELKDLIRWFQQKNQTTPELGLTDITKLQLLLNHAQAMHCAVYGEPLYSEPFPPSLPQGDPKEESRSLDEILGQENVLILKIITFVFGPRTVSQLKASSPPEDAWRRLVLALKITNLEIKTNTVKACFPAFKDIYDAYHGLDFENHTIIAVNGNYFTYNARQLTLTDADQEILEQIGSSTSGQSYYIHQNRDGALEITEI